MRLRVIITINKDRNIDMHSNKYRTRQMIYLFKKREKILTKMVFKPLKIPLSTEKDNV